MLIAIIKSWINNFLTIISQFDLAYLSLNLLSFSVAAISKDIVAKIDKKWMENYNTGNFQGVADLYTTDGCLMPSGVPAVPTSGGFYTFGPISGGFNASCPYIRLV